MFYSISDIVLSRNQDADPRSRILYIKRGMQNRAAAYGIRRKYSQRENRTRILTIIKEKRTKNLLDPGPGKFILDLDPESRGLKKHRI
jgi:hypothetical protein